MAPKSKSERIATLPCHHWGVFRIKNSTFTLESAHKILLDLQTKKSTSFAKAKLKIYKSGLKLRKRGRLISDKMPYNSIIRFFVFKTEPHLIFLGIDKKKKRSYYVLLFSDLNQVNEVCDIIENHKEVKPVICQPKKETVEAYCKEVQCVPVEEIKPVQVQATTFQEKKRSSSPIIIRSKVEHHHDKRHTDDMGTTTVDALLLRTNQNDNNRNCEWYSEDMRYLEYNPQLGTTTETDAGPIYMYTAHFVPSEYNNVGSCESVSGSSTSSRWSDVHSDGSSEQGVVTRYKDGRTIVMAHRGSDAGLRF